jgi:lipopolysaccharide/colanic/teichoic acid biosynthesis glycosyltransferase
MNRIDELPLKSPSWAGLGAASTRARTLAIIERSTDVVCGVIGLALTAPLMLIAALAIVLESPGPVLYSQERVGRYGRTFRMPKLRTMIPEAEADGQAVWAQEDDPRVTRVGSFLRRARLDEAPQFWNVLRGEMSLIGPRPERPEFVALLSSKIPMYQERHVVRPGITGWAQVQFRYGASIEDAAKKLEYDMYYIQNRSFFLHILILIKTAVVVLRFEGT